jgi:hypothetical protein
VSFLLAADINMASRNLKKSNFQRPIFFPDSVDLIKRFSQSNVRSTIVQSMDNITIQQILTLRNFGASGVVVNCACDNYAEVLAQASDQRFFNLTHEWLILDPHNLGMDAILNPVANINVDSLMTFVEPGTNGTLYLTDVYGRGRHLLDKLLVKTYAVWERGQGFAIFQQFSSLYHRDYRGNFENLTLKAGLVVSLDYKLSTENLLNMKFLSD